MSQETAILKDLKRGRRVTPLVALKRHGCLRLGARIFNLRHAGHDIQRELISRNGKTYAEYHLA